MDAVTVSAKGWVVIPAELRKKYGLQEGSRVVFVDYGGVLAIVPAMDEPVKEASGVLKGKRSLLSALREEKRRQRAKAK